VTCEKKMPAESGLTRRANFGILKPAKTENMRSISFPYLSVNGKQSRCPVALHRRTACPGAEPISGPIAPGRTVGLSGPRGAGVKLLRRREAMARVCCAVAVGSGEHKKHPRSRGLCALTVPPKSSKVDTNVDSTQRRTHKIRRFTPSRSLRGIRRGRTDGRNAHTMPYSASPGAMQCYART
jgi:hypothetical protein